MRERAREPRWVRTSVAAAVAVVAQVAGSDLGAQDWILEGGFDQGFTTEGALGSPTGFDIRAGTLGIWGPVGLHASFRRLAGPESEIAQRCGFASCTAGPFELSRALTTLGLGVSYDLLSTARTVSVSIELALGANVESERLRHLGTGVRSGGARIGSDLGAGAAVRVRLPPLLAGLRPTASAGYDRIRASDCPADGACLPGRSLVSLAAGLAWIP